MQEKNKISILEKRFFYPFVFGGSLVFLFFKYAVGGFVYATAAFFTRLFWEWWKSKNKN